jgi:hypothetical protein
LKRVEQAMERERKRATLPVVTKGMEREREKWIHTRKRKRDSFSGVSRTGKGVRETESNSPISDKKNSERAKEMDTHKQERESFLERVQHARERERERATLPLVTKGRESNKQGSERDREQLSQQWQNQ